MTGAESLSLDTPPVTEIRSALSLSQGALRGDSPAEGVGRDSGSAAGESFPLSTRQTANSQTPEFHSAEMEVSIENKSGDLLKSIDRLPSYQSRFIKLSWQYG